MARNQSKITEVINSLNEGDEVSVAWAKSTHQSLETGKVWNPADSEYWGLGPDLLNPTDTQLQSITVTKRAPGGSSQPAVGSLAIWYSKSGAITAAQRTKKGWYIAAGSGPVNWDYLTKKNGKPNTVLSPGQTPAAPTINTLTPSGNGYIAIAATLGSDNGSEIIDVQYRVDSDLDGEPGDHSGWTSSGQATGNFSIQVVGGFLYSVRIRAVNSRGVGADSNTKTVTTTTS